MVVILYFFVRVLIAVPFEEDPQDSSVWFFDHMFHENMFDMFKKVNGMCGIYSNKQNQYVFFNSCFYCGFVFVSARETVVGWYHTGPKIRPSDVGIYVCPIFLVKL